MLEKTCPGRLTVKLFPVMLNRVEYVMYYENQIKKILLAFYSPHYVFIKMNSLGSS